jgi:hypothetical protein
MTWLERVRAVGWDVTEFGCWEWRGTRLPNGRARIGRTNPDGVQNKYPYRITYEAVYGPIPEGLYAAHTCHNSNCVNPDHIEPSSQKRNLNMPPAARYTAGEIAVLDKARRALADANFPYFDREDIRLLLKIVDER